MPDFRFQGSWADDVTKLSWVVTRWYAPAQGRFLSEDSLLGEPRDPDSRHLYAYGAGDPVGAWDPDGRLSWSGFGRPVIKVIERYPTTGNKTWGKFSYQDGGWLQEAYAEGNNVIEVHADSFTSKITANRDYLSWRLTMSADKLEVGGETWKVWVFGSPWVEQDAIITAELIRTRNGVAKVINWRWTEMFRRQYWATFMGVENGSFYRRPGPWSNSVVIRNVKCTPYARGGVYCERDRSSEIHKGDTIQIRAHLSIHFAVGLTGADGWMFSKGLRASLVSVN